MADTIIAKRKEQKLTQAQLAEMTGIHRGMISRIESLDYIPSMFSNKMFNFVDILSYSWHPICFISRFYIFNSRPSFKNVPDKNIFQNCHLI